MTQPNPPPKWPPPRAGRLTYENFYDGLDSRLARYYSSALAVCDSQALIASGTKRQHKCICCRVVSKGVILPLINLVAVYETPRDADTVIHVSNQRAAAYPRLYSLPYPCSAGEACIERPWP